MLALLLWFAAGLAFASGIPELGIAVVTVVALNGVFAFVQEYRAEQVVAALMREVAVQALVSRDGEVWTLTANSLVPGDVVHVAAGDVIPADCVLLSSDSLTVDLSMLTGETTPVGRSPEPAGAEAGGPHLGDLECLLPAGGGVATGTGLAVVYATGSASSIGMLADLAVGVKQGASILELQVAELSRMTAVVAVLAGATTLGLAAAFTDTSFPTALTFGTGVIVALVPEGLLPTLSVSLAIGAQRMAKRGAAVRQLSAVEVVGSVTVICTDKTGTLTENSLTVEDAVGLDGTHNPPADLFLAAVLCNDVGEEDGKLSGDPLDVALWRWAVDAGFAAEDARARCTRIASVAFDARLRYMSVTCEVDGKRRTFVKGAPEAVLGLTTTVALPEPLVVSMANATGAGDRVLLLAASGDSGQMEPSGLVLFRDPPRRGVKQAITACHTAGVRVVMLTGDHPDTARAVAKAIGLDNTESTVVTGNELDGMSDSALRRLLSADAVVARVDPEQKLRIVRALRAAGEVVVVTGDGVNDAPALRAADVGVAMGLRGTEAAKQAANIVLADDNFATVVAAIEEGRSIRKNIRRFVSYVFTSNVAEMAPFLVYIFLPVPLPLAVIQALAVDIGTDLLPALALGAEAPSERTMREPPEPSSRPLLTRHLALRTFLFFGAIEALLGLGAYFAFYVADGWRPGDSFDPFQSVSRDAATVTFLGIVGGQIGCLFAQRDGSLRKRLSLTSNRLVLWGLIFECGLALAFVYVPGLNDLFKMSPVSVLWLGVVPVCAAIFIAFDQLRRVISRTRTPRLA